jgi:hypothetical protein
VAAALLFAVVGAVLSSLWPTVALLAGAVTVTLVLCIRAPAYAFFGALVLYSFEGTIKMRFSVEGAPSPVALGAALLDLAFFASLAALLVQDRGRSLAAVWKRARRGERVACTLFGAWLCLSVLQIPVSGDLVDGLEGFRLTQLYVFATLGGIVVASRLPQDRLAWILLGTVFLATAYAAIRGIVGPSFNEQTFAAQRSFIAEFGDVGRNTGSLSGPVALVSFLVPVSVLCLVLGFLIPDRRRVAWALVALAMTGIIASYVRTALVAVVAGAILLAAILLLGEEAGRRRRSFAVGLVVLVLGGGYAATLLAAEINPEARDRAQGLVNPFTDESVTARLETWGKSLENVASEPFGAGLGTVGRAVEDRRTRTTDSSYLKILREQGAPGALLFLAGLGWIVVAVAVRLSRIGPAQRPLGTAALVGFGSFLVLMLMGEYVEQPGKLFAWTLLGVAIWEVVGRRASADPRAGNGTRRKLPSASLAMRRGLARVKHLPRPALALLVLCPLMAVLLGAGLTTSRQREYRSTSTLVLPAPSSAIPKRAAVIVSGLAQAALDKPDFQRDVADKLEFLPAWKVPRQVRATSRRLGERWEYRLTASDRTPRGARDLAQASLPALTGVSSFQALLQRDAERRRLVRLLRKSGLERRRRVMLRRELVALRRRPLDLIRPSVPTSPTRSDRLVDRLADAVPGDPSPAPTLAWAGLAGLMFGVAASVSVLLLLGGRRRQAGQPPTHYPP